MYEVIKHYVTFLSPGSFCSETSTREIDTWDIHEAMRMADGVVERYGATPYAFYFTSRGRMQGELDSKQIERSPMYFLGGTVRTAEQVLAGTDPGERILRLNVEDNGIKKIIDICNSYKTTMELPEDAIILDYTPPKKRGENNA